MVRVVAAQVVDVQRHLRVVDEALEELVHEVDVELADKTFALDSREIAILVVGFGIVALAVWGTFTSPDGEA